MNDFPILLLVYIKKLATWKSGKSRENDREEKMASLKREYGREIKYVVFYRRAYTTTA